MNPESNQIEVGGDAARDQTLRATKAALPGLFSADSHPQLSGPGGALLSATIRSFRRSISGVGQDVGAQDWGDLLWVRRGVGACDGRTGG